MPAKKKAPPKKVISKAKLPEETPAERKKRLEEEKKIRARR